MEEHATRRGCSRQGAAPIAVVCPQEGFQTDREHEAAFVARTAGPCMAMEVEPRIGQGLDVLGMQCMAFLGMGKFQELDDALDDAVELYVCS